MEKLIKYFKVKRGVKGLGLFTTIAIKREQKILEYTGEVITSKEADRRGGQYLFEINSKWKVDGKTRKNLARYINHSCTPNCETDIKNKRIFIYSKRNIKEGEELTYDYGKDFWNDYIKPKGCRCRRCKRVSK